MGDIPPESSLLADKHPIRINVKAAALETHFSSFALLAGKHLGESEKIKYSIVVLYGGAKLRRTIQLE